MGIVAQYYTTFPAMLLNSLDLAYISLQRTQKSYEWALDRFFHKDLER